MNRTTVGKWLKEAGMGTSDPQSKPLAKTEAIAMKKADPSVSSEKIAKKVGASGVTVGKWLKEANL